MTRMVFDVANDCRSALLDILGAHATTWGPGELAAWLAGPYRKATRWARQSAARQGPPGTSNAPPASEATVRELFASARRSATFHLDRLAHGDGAFVREAMANEMVVPRCDGNSGRIVPVDMLRMRLVDRILSLAAADCLTRPFDYTRELRVCTECCSISFDQACEHVAIPGPVSGIQLKGASSKAI